MSGGPKACSGAALNTAVPVGPGITCGKAEVVQICYRLTGTAWLRVCERLLDWRCQPCAAVTLLNTTLNSVRFCFTAPRRIRRRRRRRDHLPPRVQARPRRHRLEAEGLALSLRPLPRLAQDEEPGCTSGEFRAGNGSGSAKASRSQDRLKMKNTDAPAVKREAEEDRGR